MNKIQMIMSNMTAFCADVYPGLGSTVFLGFIVPNKLQ